ncbi:low-affinity phosphate transporter [Paecilomyces lecythidis]
MACKLGKQDFQNSWSHDLRTDGWDAYRKVARLRLSALPSVGAFSDHDAAVAPSPTQSIELVDFDPAARTHIGERRQLVTVRDSDTAQRLGRGVGYKDRGSETEKGRGHSGRKDHGEKYTDDFRPPGLERKQYWEEAVRRRVETARGERKEAKMKFSHSLQFNSVPDWSAYYIGYSNLKKLIYGLEKQVHQPDGQDGGDVESAPLLDSTIDTDTIFRRALDAELEKICSFYQVKEMEIFREVEELVKDERAYAADTDGVNMDPVSETVIKARGLSLNSRQRPGSLYRNLTVARGRRASTISESAGDEEEDGDDGDSDDDDQPESPNGTRRKRSRSRSLRYRDYDPSEGNPSELGDSRLLGDSRILGSEGRSTGRPALHEDHLQDPRFMMLYNSGVTLKKRAISVYVSLCELKSYIQLNKTGFSKALKKYDKILDRNMRRHYMNTTVSQAYPFTDATMQKLDEHISQVEKVYADIVTKGDVGLAKRELRLHLREHVVWERNTVWREMIGIERKAQAANMGIRRTLLGGDQSPSTAQRQGDVEEAETTELKTPLGRYSVPGWLCSLSFGTLLAILIIFAVLLNVPILKKPEQQNCLAMLVLVSLLWATEVIPLFVTSLLIPFLVVVLRIMRSESKPHERLEPKAATAVVFASMWTPVIMLLLGGFTIAAALSKYDIARRMATFVLSKAGTTPRTVLVTNMFVSMFLSMWISNVASPVLCYSIIQPLLRNLPADSNFSKALVLGIALAANIGGAASPIASPQNIIALQNMYPSISWGTWFFISLPVCIVSILLIWALLLITFHPGRGTTIVPIRTVKDKFSGVQWFITIVTITTIILWCVSHQLEHVFGDMGVIAIIPLVLFFGTGILTKEDFNNFLWTIIILAAGGLCLGKSVTSSGLLHNIAGAITEKVDGLSLYGVLLVFASLILVIATFISHTVAALIILPLVQQVGVGMNDPHPNLLVMASALMCSVAMGLPTSGFPNMTAIMMEVPQTGQRYLRVQHFLTRGIPASLVSFAVVVTVGYGLMVVAGL